MMNKSLHSGEFHSFEKLHSNLETLRKCEIVSVYDSHDGLRVYLEDSLGVTRFTIHFETFRGYRSFDEGDLYFYFQKLRPKVREGIYRSANSEFLNWAKNSSVDPDSYVGCYHYIISSVNWVIEILSHEKSPNVQSS